MSPSQKLLYIAGSPARLIKKTVRPGSTNSSVFSLIIICLGAGTLTIPYVFYENGILFGTVCVLFGAVLSVYTGYLIA